MAQVVHSEKLTYLFPLIMILGPCPSRGALVNGVGLLSQGILYAQIRVTKYPTPMVALIIFDSANIPVIRVQRSTFMPNFIVIGL